MITSYVRVLGFEKDTLCWWSYSLLFSSLCSASAAAFFVSRSGTYFATQSCKSSQYAHSMQQMFQRSEMGTMILARVAIGDPYYTAGPCQRLSRFLSRRWEVTDSLGMMESSENMFCRTELVFFIGFCDFLQCFE